MRIFISLSLGLLSLSLAGCAAKVAANDPTFNERMLKTQNDAISAGENPFGDEIDRVPTANPAAASLWSRSEGSPYLIRNQKAQHVGDLLTIIVDESATATTSAGTDTSRDAKVDIGITADLGQGAAEQIGELGFGANHKNEFKGKGKTDRSGRLTTTVQAVVENVLQNGTLYVRGRKVITINNEDQEVEISGFVRPDDIRINNTVISSVMADAKIRYVGEGVVSDKQRVGWGMRLLDAIWPF